VRIIDLARRVLDATGSDSELVYVPYESVYGRGIEDMVHRMPSIEKVRGAIGWEPTLTLERILDDVIDHVRGEPETQPLAR
jgi:UDP-glucose 4-epimerase